MLKLVVSAKKLNKRRFVPITLSDKSGIVGTVNKDFSFLGTEATSSEVPNGATGKWYKDRDGIFYWGGGLIENPIPLSGTINTGKRDWGFVDYKIDQLWSNSKGENIKMAVLDSGLNASLADFAGMQNLAFFNANTGSDDKNQCGDDSDSHGTNCAGVLCAQGSSLWGVAPAGSLQVIRITDANGARQLDAILNGLQKAIDLNTDVISMSFGISGDPKDEIILKLYEKIKAAYDLNITLVAAVSDGSSDFPVNDFPASFPECIAVGAVDSNRMVASNQSDFLDLMAPGKNVFSVSNQLADCTGSSFATPFVAGVVAILKSVAKVKNKTVSNIELFDILKRSADIQVLNYNKLNYGWGLINPVGALNLLQTI